VHKLRKVSIVKAPLANSLNQASVEAKTGSVQAKISLSGEAKLAQFEPIIPPGEASKTVKQSAKASSEANRVLSNHVSGGQLSFL